MRRGMAKTTMLAVAVAGLVGACSAEFSIGGQSPEDAAVDLIEGELSDELGVAMTGECDDVDDPEVGVSFDCTGTTDDGDVVEFVTLIDDDDHISVDSVNLVTAEGVPQYEAAAAEALTEQAGVTLDPADVDCGDDPVIFDSSMTMPCTVTDPSNGDVYDATLTVTDLEAGLFDIEVGDLRG